MVKPRALEPSATGLPWTCGFVHTAKCSICRSANKTMFRRCKDCTFTLCTACHNHGGFRHSNCADGQPAVGPFPSHAQETAIVGLFDMVVPPHDESKTEDNCHAGWVWIPPALVLKAHPDVQMVGRNIMNTTSTKIAIGSIPAPSKPLKACKAKASKGSDLNHAPSSVGYSLPIFDNVVNFASKARGSSAAILSSSPLPPSSSLWGASSSPAPALAASEKEDEDETDSAGEVMMTTDAEQGAANRVLAEALNFDKSPTTLVSTRPRRQLKRPLVYDSISDEYEDEEAESPPLRRRSKSMRVTKLHPDTKLMSREVSKTMAVAFDAKTGIRSKRTLDIDVRGLDTLKLTLYPGFRLGNRTDIHETGITTALPAQLYYQWQNASNDKMVRETVAVLEAEGSRVEVPVSSTIGPCTPSEGTGMARDIHNVFVRAITGDKLAGDVDGFLKLTEE